MNLHHNFFIDEFSNVFDISGGYEIEYTSFVEVIINLNFKLVTPDINRNWLYLINDDFEDLLEELATTASRLSEYGFKCYFGSISSTGSGTNQRPLKDPMVVVLIKHSKYSETNQKLASELQALTNNRRR